MIEMKVLINIPIKIIELILAPTKIIINGPKATLGKELRIVKYGSIILYPGFSFAE